ncbi:PREDICTED: probable LRR receptor-like serine/threonine-protein kinase At1g53430 isoform X2 [Populus euphratica]|uniref:non-specific serine/threonine protein kinase n=1 Tax=Populus euphratica TaxID=75702 RepID=A0AAJ6Y2Q6_POPEU|nr:PREDICTED: probable LRR receptor-like serine/threonine-protein kinase At1g53430 isoform X2 [Populus euphratica]
MSKPIGSEWSVMLISILFLLNCLLFSQPCSGASFAFGDQIDEVARNGSLPDHEVRALRLLSKNLLSQDTTQLTLTYPICSTELDFEITCSCHSIRNQSVCSVTRIKLPSKNLDGSIDPSIGNFANLEGLNLFNNQLSGEIPSTLGYLQHLTYLYVKALIPCSIFRNDGMHRLCLFLNHGTMTVVNIRNLASNSLTGSIPPSLTMLHNLEHLFLSNNDLDGPIPQNLTGLQSLRILNLSNNQLTGPIPDSIRFCQNLIKIYLRLNFLSGTINENLGNLSSLMFLDLYSNKLSGIIPKELGKLSFLSFLNLDDNDLHGELPKELGSLTNLRQLYLTANNFTGAIPTTYAKLINLEEFAVGGNYLSGPIPDYFGKWVKLTKLVLIGNNFEGNLSAQTFSLPSLQRLYVQSFDASIVFNFNVKIDMKVLFNDSRWVSDVSNPGISFPEEVPEQKSLFSVILRNCKINGSIPKDIGNWSQLKYLDLSFNNLSGSVPETFQRLNKLFLTNNTLSGLPNWTNNSTSVYPTADLSYNNFNVTCENATCLGLQNVSIHPTRFFIDEMRGKKCGRRHNSLFINSGGEEVDDGKNNYHNDTSLSRFNLSPSEDWAYSYAGDYLWAKVNASTLVRNLTCEITSSKANIDNNFRLAPVSLTYYGLCLRKGKYIVTLYFAEALYSKSEDYSTSGKRVFDIYIQGMIVKKDVNIKEIPGKEHEERRLQFEVKINDGSLEIKFFWAGKGSLYNPPGLNGPLISAVSITRVPRKLHGWEIALIAVGCILFLLLLLAFMWRMGWIGDRELRETKVKIGERTFTLKQIIDATKKFSPKMELGRGRSGIVYRAQLPDLTVAVKKLVAQSNAVDEIATEVYFKKAKELKHDNIVKLLYIYSRRRLHLLIYEFMEVGSLGQVLFGTNSTVRIDWPKRFIICKYNLQGNSVGFEVSS